MLPRLAREPARLCQRKGLTMSVTYDPASVSSPATSHLRCDTCSASAPFNPASAGVGPVGGSRHMVPGLPNATPADGWCAAGAGDLPAGWQARMAWTDAYGQAMRLEHRCPDCAP